MSTTPKRSYKSVSSRKAGAIPFEFELMEDDGSGSGILVQVLGGHSEKVTQETNRLVADRRSKEAIRAAAATSPADEVRPPEEDIEFGRLIAAARLVGWSFEEPCTPEAATEFCVENPHYAAQIITRSNKTTNFTKASPKA
ncbi:MAG: hypothetical protein HY859_09545 [Caulobacterales bacterium]|nr:hypothetical protein [Caulobacterales bacterium]